MGNFSQIIADVLHNAPGQQTTKISDFIEVLTPADEQLIKCFD